MSDLWTIAHARSVRALVEPRVRRVVAEYLAVDDQALRESISIRDDLAVDSLDLLELALILEGEFAVTLPDRLVHGMRSYGDVVEAIVARLGTSGLGLRAAEAI